MVTDKQLLAARKPVDELPPWTQDPATPPQVNYITGLVRSREIPESWLVQIKALVENGLKKGDAGKIINSLKTLPLKPGQDDRSKNRPTIQDVPPGRYAVQTGQDANDLSFYRVKDVRGGPTKQGGFRIVLQIAGPNEHVLAGQAAQDAIKKIVRFGIGDAAVLYGRKVGRCSQCNTRITNRLSRELGIGPICGGRVYEDWDSRVTRARTAVIERGEDPTENVYD